ncbi:helix-turn-helix domain-containing protein [Enterococcus sp. AZ196]|uniref:helix-turn-helix domain-containing protein n=1 Tax=Enterococcus sp. AZ196 TaxID=2774659 RepID=UPI003D28BA84
MEKLFDQSKVKKMTLVHYILSGPNQTRKISEIIRDLKMERRGVKKLGEELMTDIQLVAQESAECSLELDDNTYQLTGQVEDLLSRLILYYGKRSDLFQLLHMVVKEKSFSITGYEASIHLASGSFYDKKKELNGFLADYGLKIGAKHQLTGEEYPIRQLLFSIYHTLFKDIESPFEAYIQAEAQQLFNQLLSEELKAVTLCQGDQSKLMMYLMITVIRINNGHFLHKNNDLLIPGRQSSSTIPFIQERFNLSKERANLEYQFIQSFLELEKIVPYPTMVYTVTVMRKINQIAGDFLKFLNQYHIDESNTQLLYTIDFAVRNMFKNVLLSSSMRVDSLIYLRESDLSDQYPVQFKICQAFLESYFKKEPLLDPALLTNRSLMLHLLTSLEAVLEIGNLRYEVALRLDFYSGTSYQENIRNLIEHKLNLPITIVNTAEKAHIVVADHQVHPKLGERVLMWNYPPTPTDWEVLTEWIREEVRKQPPNRDS